MHLIEDNMFKFGNKLTYMCITTNSTIKTNGELVMGKGNALEAKKLLPSLPKIFANLIKEKVGNIEEGIVPDYHLISYHSFIAFQTKRNWRDPSPLELVIGSIQRLERLALKYPESTFGLPAPGCSNGGLKMEDIEPYLLNLPDNVYVFTGVYK